MTNDLIRLCRRLRLRACVLRWHLLSVGNGASILSFGGFGLAPFAFVFVYYVRLFVSVTKLAQVRFVHFERVVSEGKFPEDISLSFETSIFVSSSFIEHGT